MNISVEATQASEHSKVAIKPIPVRRFLSLIDEFVLGFKESYFSIRDSLAFRFLISEIEREGGRMVEALQRRT